MFASVVLILAAVAGQPASDAAAAGGLGRAFVSPMGEPFYSNTGTNDGLATWFAKVDADHDQAITTDEMKADADKFFDRLDRNKDGEIDPDEMTIYEQTIQARSGRYSLLNIQQPVMSADTNFNRGVSLEEFRSAAAKRFRTLDVTGTGRLTLASLDGIREAAAAAAKRPFNKAQEVRLDPKAATEGVIRPH
jgi:Ca2+-binding EF-hand superfamily protein